MDRRQKYRLVLLFAGIWVAVIFAPVFFKDFRPPPEVNAGLPAIIGALLALPQRSENNGARRETNGARNGEIPAGRSRDEEGDEA